MLLVAAAAGGGELKFQPYAVGTYEYNSNIAAVAPGDPANVLQGDPQHADRIKRGTAGLNARYGWSRQVLTLQAEGRRYSYDHFSRLDHDESLLSANLDWQLASALDGKLSASRERRMADLKTRLSSELVLETERDASGSVNFHLAPDWRLETGAKRRDLDSPQPGFPDYGLRETTGDLALKFLGPARWTFGLAGEHVSGDYHGGTLVPSYRQNSIDATASYGDGEPTLLKAALGHTRRSDPAVNAPDLSATTGLLSYARKLTGKTAVLVSYQRAVNSYVIAAASEVDSTATLKVDWEATRKLSVVLGYSHTGSTFSGELVPFTNTARSDQYAATSLDVGYAITRWVTLSPYGLYQTRTSNVSFFQYNGALVGVRLRIQRP
ncbi:MAG: outer membrane beta-barrel protein [Gammaproteobacteria bacterium]|nr:outer membrane beta-barrel protein [Gammaproteobacteria bacterium]